MLKEEFETLVDKCVTSSDYEKINHVYTWHPSISETNGKEQIAELYKQYGMSIILQMTEAADYGMKIEQDIADLRKQMNELDERYNDLKRGDLNFERCYREVEKYFSKSENPKEFEELLGNYVCPYYPVGMIERAKKLVM